MRMRDVNNFNKVYKEEKPLSTWQLCKLSTKDIYDDMPMFQLHASSQFKIIEMVSEVQQNAYDHCIIPTLDPHEIRIEAKKTRANFLHLGCIRIGIEPLHKVGIPAFALTAVFDNRFNKFVHALIGGVQGDLARGPIWFDYHSNVRVFVIDPNLKDILQAKIPTKGYDMKPSSENIAIHYKLALIYTSTLCPSVLHAPDRDSESSTLVYTFADNVKLVPQAISWEQLDFPTEWVVQDPKPSPQITFNTADIAENHTQAIIQFSPRRFVSSKSSYHASHTTRPECSHTRIFQWPPIPRIIQFLLCYALVSNQFSHSSQHGEVFLNFPSTSSFPSPKFEGIDPPIFTHETIWMAPPSILPSQRPLCLKMVNTQPQVCSPIHKNHNPISDYPSASISKESCPHPKCYDTTDIDFPHESHVLMMHHILELETDDPRLIEIFSYCRPPGTPRYGLGYIEQTYAIIPSCIFENPLPTGLQKPSVSPMNGCPRRRVNIDWIKRMLNTIPQIIFMNGCPRRRVNIDWIKRMLNWDMFTHPQAKEFNATTSAELKKDLSEQWQTYMTIKDLWKSFYEWYRLSQKEAIQMMSAKESVSTKHKWKALDGQTVETDFPFPPFKEIILGEEEKQTKATPLMIHKEESPQTNSEKRPQSMSEQLNLTNIALTRMEAHTSITNDC
jgi:hypothetical protein